MITPVTGIQHAVSLVDGIAGIRSHLPPLVVAVTSADGCETARGFLTGYHRRLSVDEGHALVPHALGAGRLPAAAAERSMPDVKLLNNLAGQLSATMPPGAGRRWRPSLFETSHDVITPDAVQRGLVVDQRRQLRDHLYSAWEKRTPWLAWIQRMVASPSMPNKTFGLVATVVFSGPNRWWFGRRLNSSRWRWFGEHVRPVTGLQGDFLSHALNIVSVGPLHDNAPLRRRILIDALLHDLDRLVKRRRFFPHRRRRRWTPVLSLDCTSEKGLVCLDVVQSFIELTENKPTSPLLVIAAMEPDALESAASTPHPVNDAVERLQEYVNHTPGALTSKPWLPVLLTSEPEDRAAGDWLKAHRKVTPRIPGKVSAWAPVAITVVIALAATAVVTYQYLFGYCADTWTNDLGERVGLSHGGCEFTPVILAAGFLDLRRLENDIRENNATVDSMKDSTGAPRDYRNVVFFAPLTRPSGVSESTASANALWQLRGAVDAQQQRNYVAKTNTSSVPIKLLLANSGDKFANGPDVASVIAKQPLAGPGSVAAVIGISQSRPESLEAIGKMRGIPVIGSSLFGNHMTEGHEKFFMVAPPNDLFAQAMVAWARANTYAKAVIVYDSRDEYFSKDLRDSLDVTLRREGFSLEDDLELNEQDPQSGTPPIGDPKVIVKKLCEDYVTKRILPVLAGRADQLAKLFAAAGDHEVPACTSSEGMITMLAGGGAIVGVASGQLNNYVWLNLAFPVLAKTSGDPAKMAAESDEATGNDALIAASDAINASARASGNNPSAQGVLNLLSQGFTVVGDTGQFEVTAKDHQDRTSHRVQIQETRPNS